MRLGTEMVGRRLHKRYDHGIIEMTELAIHPRRTAFMIDLPIIFLLLVKSSLAISEPRVQNLINVTIFHFMR